MPTRCTVISTLHFTTLKRNAVNKQWTHLLFSFSIFFNLFLSTSSWAWRRVFSCLKRLFWDSEEDIWILLARSSSVAARSLSAAAARRVWDSPNSKKKTWNLTFLIKHLEYEPFPYISKLNLRFFFNVQLIFLKKYILFSFVKEIKYFPHTEDQSNAEWTDFRLF